MKRDSLTRASGGSGGCDAAGHRYKRRVKRDSLTRASGGSGGCDTAGHRYKRRVKRDSLTRASGGSGGCDTAGHRYKRRVKRDSLTRASGGSGGCDTAGHRYKRRVKRDSLTRASGGSGGCDTAPPCSRMIKTGVPAPHLAPRMGQEAIRSRGGVVYRELHSRSLLEPLRVAAHALPVDREPLPRLRHGLPLLLCGLHPRVHGHHNARGVPHHRLRETRRRARDGAPPLRRRAAGGADRPRHRHRPLPARRGRGARHATLSGGRGRAAWCAARDHHQGRDHPQGSRPAAQDQRALHAVRPRLADLAQAGAAEGASSPGRRLPRCASR